VGRYNRCVAYDPSRLAWTAAVLAWVLAVPLYVATTVVATVAHEGGHAIVGTLLFRRVRDIRLKPNGEGATSFGEAGMPWLFHLLTLLAGYLGPSMFGLLAVVLLVHDLTGTVLWGSVAFLAVMLLAVRGWFGLILVPALMALIVVVATRFQPPLQTLFTHVWVWFLLIAPVQDMIVHMRGKGFRSPTSDTGAMHRLTRVSGEAWAVLLLAGTVAALVYGGGLLLRHAA
jgi:hypothetical protein